MDGLLGYGSDSDSDETNCKDNKNTPDIVVSPLSSCNKQIDENVNNDRNLDCSTADKATSRPLTEMRSKAMMSACVHINDNTQHNNNDQCSPHYFGLFTAISTDDSDCESDREISSSSNKPLLISSQSERNKIQRTQYMNNLRCKEENQCDGPSGSFWKGIDESAVDWTKTDEIWKTASDDIAIEPSGIGKFSKIKAYKSSKLEPNNKHKDHDSTSNFKLKKSCFFIHNNIAPVLNYTESAEQRNRLPKRHVVDLAGHAGAVNRIKWCSPNYSHLLLSASMDQTVKVWNTMAEAEKCVQNFSHHTKAVKDAKWSHDGHQILSCGYDKTSRLMDVESGVCLRVFEEENFVTCLENHPVNYHLFISGSSNRISAWDKRKPSSPVQLFRYKDVFGQVQDLEFLPNGREFFSCNDLVSRDSADRNIMAWDFLKGVTISNQIYQERFTCTRLRVHRREPHVLAQSQGDYIAQFSTIRPYKMNKCKRFEGHKVVGYNIGLDISPDGRILMSGSSEGLIPFYDYRTTRKIGTVNLGREEVCLDVAWHPLLPSTIATATWGGSVTVWM